MSCNSCTKSFSVLRREKGCPSCGFSYCSNCLNNKVFLPKLNCETKVCAKCKRLIVENNEKKEVFIPPDAYYKRLAATEEKSKNREIQERLQNLKRDNESNTSVSKIEEDIAKRLQNIKGDTPSTEELQTRLAKLRGMESLSSQSKTALPAPDVRTEQEQADDLMKQYIEQAKIDTDYNTNFDGIISDIENRVQKLKGNSASSGQTTSGSQEILKSEEDEDEAFKQIIEKVKAQSLLEHNEISTPTNDELPFCEICNEDAKMRCLGCRYLYCKQCYLEHKDDDDGCNRYEPYNPPESY